MTFVRCDNDFAGRRCELHAGHEEKHTAYTNDQNSVDNALEQLHESKVRIKELEDAIRLHRTKVQLVQTEDMELWAHLNDGEQ